MFSDLASLLLVCVNQANEMVERRRIMERYPLCLDRRVCDSNWQSTVDPEFVHNLVKYLDLVIPDFKIHYVLQFNQPMYNSLVYTVSIEIKDTTTYYIHHYDSAKDIAIRAIRAYSDKLSPIEKMLYEAEIQTKLGPDA